MDVAEWCMVGVSAAFFVWLGNELQIIRLPVFGSAAAARKQATQAAIQEAQRLQPEIQAQIDSAAARGLTKVDINPRLFDHNCDVMWHCAKQCRRNGYRVFNKYLGMGVYKFTVSW